MTSFAARGGWWVVAQAVLLALYGYAFITTASVAPVTGLVVVRALGWGLLAAGVALGVWAMAVHGGRVSPFPAPGERLVVDGPYGLVRHPIYLAVVLGTVGGAIAAARPAALLFGILFVPFFVAKSAHEEAMLVERFPGYREYRARVPHRIIPWPW